MKARWRFYEKAFAPISELFHPTFLDYDTSTQIRRLNSTFFPIEENCFSDFRLLLLLGEGLKKFSEKEGEFFYKALIEKTDEEQRTMIDVRGGGPNLEEYLAQHALKWPAAFCLKALRSHSMVVEMMKSSKAVCNHFIKMITNYKQYHTTSLNLYKSELNKNPSDEKAEIYKQKIETLKDGLIECDNFLFILRNS